MNDKEGNNIGAYSASNEVNIVATPTVANSKLFQNTNHLHCVLCSTINVIITVSFFSTLAPGMHRRGSKVPAAAFEIFEMLPMFGQLA